MYGEQASRKDGDIALGKKGSIIVKMNADLEAMDEDEFDKVIENEKARAKAEKRNQRAGSHHSDSAKLIKI